MNQVAKKGGKGKAVIGVETGDVKYIPVAQLRLSPRNVRQGPVREIEALAASILAQGVLQNLVVTLPEVGVAEVEAGRRRLLALQLLLQKGSIQDTYPVPCRVVPLEQAVAASLAENIMREEMHPADQYLAFKALADAGKPTEDIAAVFGVSPVVVTRRMKLATISPRLMNDYREGKVSLEQLMALTVSDDHGLQEAAFYNVEGWRRQPQYIRQTLLSREISGSDQLARFVTIEGYEQAGGVTKRDLFTEGEGSVLLQDKGLLEKLAFDKLNAMVPALIEDGWQFVDVVLRLTDELGNYSEEYGDDREPTPGEQARVDAIEARLDVIQELFDGELSQDAADALEVEQNRLEEDQHLLRRSLVTYTDAVKASAGVVLTVTEYGLPALHCGLVKDLNPPHGGDDTDHDSGDIEGAEKPAARQPVQVVSAEPTKPARPALSEKLAFNLTAHYTAGMQLALARNAHVALAATVHSMLMRLLSHYYHDSALRLRLDRCSGVSEHLKEDPSTASDALAAMLKTWLERLPSGSQSIFAALIALSQDELVQLLAICSAHSVDAVSARAERRNVNAWQLADALHLDMREWWQPTAAGYFSRVSKSMILEAVAEFAPEQLPSLQALKKGELAAAAEQLAAGKGWLPPVLKTPAFTVDPEADSVNEPEGEDE